jgi:hypothetical protein
MQTPAMKLASRELVCIKSLNLTRWNCFGAAESRDKRLGGKLLVLLKASSSRHGMPGG